MNDTRNFQLRSLFTQVLKGNKKIDQKNAKLFLEAIVKEENPETCIQRIVSSSHGMSALRTAWSCDNSVSFLNSTGANFIRYLTDDGLKVVCGGQVLSQIVLIIVESSMVWKSFIGAAKSDKLGLEALEMFAWILLQLFEFPINQAIGYIEYGQDVDIKKILLNSSKYEIRSMGIRIAHLIESMSSDSKELYKESGPGGRHDNDFREIRQISILPTPDELISKDPYLPRASDLEEILHDKGLPVHIDSQFRLLREDMIRDLREEIQAALDSNSKRKKPFIVENLSMIGVGADGRNPWIIQLNCLPDLKELAKKKGAERKKFLQDHDRYLKHESLVCIMIDKTIISLATINRNVDQLCQSPPMLSLAFPKSTVKNALLKMKRLDVNIRMIQLNTALFAYEPVLKQLQEIREISLEYDLVKWREGDEISPPLYNRSPMMTKLIDDLKQSHSYDLKDKLDLSESIKLDISQRSCLIACLEQRVSAIQGPPGTGKSFIGSLATKSLYKFTREKILCVFYTHHTLDQFLEGLQKMGIPNKDMARLGSTKKATPKTLPLGLREQQENVKFSRYSYDLIQKYKKLTNEKCQALQKVGGALSQINVSKRQIFDYLEFLEDLPSYYEAFEISQNEDYDNDHDDNNHAADNYNHNNNHNKKYNHTTRVGRKGKAIDEFYLFDRWYRGRDAGIFQKIHPIKFPEVWQMTPSQRLNIYQKWKDDLLQQHFSQICEVGNQYNRYLHLKESMFKEKDVMILNDKRIIACTTTAAAKYSEILKSIRPGILLVEEAGEILESHILTSIGSYTNQLILIGDHKQLRPKVHHDLSVEKGDGYDLNRSLFERLILKKYPHQVLNEQHRMRPEISTLVRELTYPDLVDAPSTKLKKNLRGFIDNIMFINHNVKENDMIGVPEFIDNTVTSSKRNEFEANMTLKCVKYLGQQGYRTDNIAILTPYLGQLRLLVDKLSKDTDPVLNDLDSHDLVRAGLMPSATAKVNKPRIRISTIDNFQGDESDVIVISLTRSNSNNDIGFMYSPERLNVLLSRARESLIMIGDLNNFMNARKGKELWSKLFSILKRDNHIYEGFPIKCERHPLIKSILKKPEDFDLECPDGGCKNPCDKLLNCGFHKCPSKCHQLFDHSKMECEAEVDFKCKNGHLLKTKCYKSVKIICRQCEVDEKKKEKDLEIERIIKEKRDQETILHSTKITEIDREIKLLRAEMINDKLLKDQKIVLEQKKRDLENAKESLKEMKNKNLPNSNTYTTNTNTKTNTNTVSQPSNVRNNDIEVDKSGSNSTLKSTSNSSSQDKSTLNKNILSSPSEEEWKRQKDIEGASNKALDDLMKLTGLEQVKSKFLDIKASIEISERQGIDIGKQRYGMTMLGNPGTGKTTVARLYGEFLCSINAIPGKGFFESTGSSLANDGVSGTKKKIEELIKEGGGVFFLDEAYQLASGSNHGGSAVLDFLLAEIEDRRGLIVFIIAGYKKEMEKFFEHNPGFDSRMPHTLLFNDYTDQELRIMFNRMIQMKYNEKAKIEDGLNGLYSRILITRLGRQRGKEGFGNARSLENVWSLVTERQANRIRFERKSGVISDDLFFKKEDIIGPEPSKVIFELDDYKKLQNLIGLKSVKESIKSLISRIDLNYKRELQEKSLIEISLNKIFLGSPGTGKTTVAKLYGSILCDLGLLSKGDVIMKNPSDFIGSVMGESEKNTKAILKSSEGKVLVIDEAYMLSSASQTGTKDPYRTAVLDTIVAEIQSTPGEDRCVLLLGYRNEMEEMLRNSNPGLARRFPLESSFQFDDFNDNELGLILDLKLNDQGLKATDKAKDVAIKLLSKQRDRPNFGNAGAIENLLSNAKNIWQNRITDIELRECQGDVIFQPQDFDEKYDRTEKSQESVRELFKDIVGHEKLIEKLEGYQKMAKNMILSKKDPRKLIPYNFIFKGPPGTGKTTIARKMARLFYEIGILPTDEFKECSSSDLVAQYIGQTGPKTKEVLQTALGRVLFIDEAYRLNDDRFGKEAVDEIVDCLTKDEFIGKIIIILAGYSDNMNDFLRVNPGLSSRFSEEVLFENMSPNSCLLLLEKLLIKEGFKFENDIINESSMVYKEMLRILNDLSNLESWGNGRDIITISKRIASTYYKSIDLESIELDTEDDKSMMISNFHLIDALNDMLKEQKLRCQKNQKDDTDGRSQNHFKRLNQMFSQPPQALSPILSTKFNENIMTKVEEKTVEELDENRNHQLKTETVDESIRDKGVSNEIWEQLQLDMKLNKERDEKYQEMDKEIENDIEKLKKKEQSRESLMKMTETKLEQNEDDELRRKMEIERINAVDTKRKRQEYEEKIKKLREEEEIRKKKEAKAQEKLRSMGVCPVGFKWIKQNGGYRCAGGSHFVDDSKLL